MDNILWVDSFVFFNIKIGGELMRPRYKDHKPNTKIIKYGWMGFFVMLAVALINIDSLFNKKKATKGK